MESSREKGDTFKRVICPNQFLAHAVQRLVSSNDCVFLTYVMIWREMAIKRLITIVSVSLSSVIAWRMGSIQAVVTRVGLMTLVVSFIAKEGAGCVSVMCGLLYMNP